MKKNFTKIKTITMAILSFGGIFAAAKRSELVKEILAVMVLSASLLVFLSLVSFSPNDVLVIKSSNEISNILGTAGASIADVLLSFFGLFAYCFPLFLLLLSMKLFFARKFFSKSYRIWGGSLIALGLMPLFSDPWQGDYLKSGILGFYLKLGFKHYFNEAGVWIFSLTIVWCGVVLCVSRPFFSDLAKSILLVVKNIKGKIFSAAFSCFKRATKKSPPKVVVKKEEVVETKALQKEPNLNPSKENEDIQILKRQKEEIIKSTIPRGFKRPEDFTLPPLKLLDYDEPTLSGVDEDKLKKEANKLQEAFLQFGIEGKIREIRPGPVVVNYEFVPAPGIKLSRIASLSDDIAMAISATQVRIVAPIPGKGAVGIEVPNDKREMVYLKEIVANKTYAKEPHKLSMAVGKDVEGKAYFMNLADMPHVLIAGTTGSGKSVSVNAMICSILYRATPKDVRFLMIDPKMLELSIYNGIPHLLLPPIIDAKKAANALKWAVKEMDLRYELMKEAFVRDIDVYNQKVAAETLAGLKPVQGRNHEHLPYIVVVIDEYADLLAVAGKEVEGYIMRLAQKARAAGIHVMLATQRPSVDVITGVIKANFPVRMGFRLASAHDSKTIINRQGAEKLLGRGDVLIMPPGTSDVYRVHGAFISEKELMRVINFYKEQGPVNYDNKIADFEEKLEGGYEETASDACDEKLEEAIAIVREYNKCSTSFLQRQLSIGYNRAAKLVEHMEKTGVVGPSLNAKGDREIFTQESF